MQDAAAMPGRWAELFAAQDGAGLASLYTDTALFYGSTPALRRGPVEIAAYYEALKGLSNPSVVFTDAVLNAVAPGVIDLACMAAFSFGGPPSRGRFTWTLVGHDGGWRIACHHASPLPADRG